MTRARATSHRYLVPGLLAAMLLLSLVFSTAQRYGHADAPIARTAEEIQPLGVGDPAPRFQVRDVDGAAVTFDPARLERPAIIITFRGGWCPYCNMHLSELRHVLPEIRELGIDVLFLSGDRPDQLYRSLASDTQSAIDGRGYRILSDADVNAATAFGIAFRASDRTIARRHEKGDDIDGSSMSKHRVLPVPAVFAVGRDGMIEFAYANPDYKVRVPAAELLDVARGISGG
ncbi:MAG: peroxiredoxin-like family protein [Woeseiaceae bacterium]|nr:peroxiredoxin-like family protein [Woeseiaceae bacterium]